MENTIFGPEYRQLKSAPFIRMNIVSNTIFLEVQRQYQFKDFSTQKNLLTGEKKA